jgi:hypothetical protein
MSKLIVAPCPVCGKDALFDETRWLETIRDQLKGKEPMLPCPDRECGQCRPAREWHRVYEKIELARRGWV